MTSGHISLNGAPASIDDLRAIASLNYGHFTSMQVRDGCVRGLDLHFERLARATQELFGSTLDIGVTREWMRRVAGVRGNVSLRVTVFSRSLDRDRPVEPVAPDVLVVAEPPRERRSLPLRVCSVRYARELPRIKHVGTFGPLYQKRLAQARGFDDALFVGQDGRISEGTIWNAGFFDGSRVVWPDAPALEGVSMQLLKSGLEDAGVTTVTCPLRLSDLGGYRAAFFTNSSQVAVPIATIDEDRFTVDPGLLATLESCAAAQPAQRL